MPDARVIPIGDGERPPRRPAPRGAAAADSVAAGASRASGERARRRSSPLLDDSAPAPAPPRKRTKTSSRAPAAPLSPAPASPEGPEAVAKETAQEAAQEPVVPVPPVVPEEMPEWERKVAAALAFVRRRLTGDVEIDEFGFDPELTEHVLLAMVRPLYDRYFRVETRGLENVPVEGGALLVANHSGTIPLDSVMTQIALLDHHPAHRHLRMLGADLVFSTPVISELARKTGTTLACNADAERLLHKGELVGVWPEGFKGIGKPFSERYKLQRFGRGGFVSAALRAQVPIIPCSIVGAEEIYPIIGNMKTLARLLGLPYVPVTPTFPLLGPLGAIPLPSKWIIEFGEPIMTDGYGLGAADDPMLVFNLTDQVRETIQHTLYRLLMARRSIFF
ncbi:MAG TPA: lysophospholipid acyltransferase family protein [Actinomycetes bacterium]